VGALIFEFTYRSAESALEFSYLGGDQLRKPQQEWRGYAAARQILDDFFEIG
jgi:hypothetical protein